MKDSMSNIDIWHAHYENLLIKLKKIDIKISLSWLFMSKIEESKKVKLTK